MAEKLRLIILLNIEKNGDKIATAIIIATIVIVFAITFSQPLMP